MLDIIEIRKYYSIIFNVKLIYMVNKNKLPNTNKETDKLNSAMHTGKLRRVLIIVENLPSPFDRRVWQEATTLQKSGYQVSIICPTGKGYDKKHEIIDDIHIYRHTLPFEANRAVGYLLEYSTALFWEFLLTWKVFLTRGFDVIHACNPPDTIFIIGLFFKLFGKKFIFDHHDINPELFTVKFGRKGILYKILLLLERWTFRVADVSIATNESYKKIAIERGGMDEEKVFVVRSGPDTTKFKNVTPNDELKKGRQYLCGYVGVMGKQDGIDVLLDVVKYLVNELDRNDVHFILIGTGTEYDYLVKYTKELGIVDNVTFTGYLQGTELLEAISTIDIGIVPDLYNDYNDKCTMNKIMEYMALGKPMVQFELTEGKFSAQQSSLYAEKNDYKDFARKIVQLMDDKELRKQLGLFGKKRLIDELAWEYEAPKLLGAYEKVFK